MTRIRFLLPQGCDRGVPGVVVTLAFLWAIGGFPTQFPTQFERFPTQSLPNAKIG
jgi:hypothetical protein